MPTPEARRARVGHLYELLVGTENVDEFLVDVARLATQHVDAQVSCGLTAHMEGRSVTIASTDQLAAELDQVQDESGEGPCLEAIATGKVVEVDDPASLDTWPAWRERALALGVRRVLSLPLTGSGTVPGAVNLYSTGGVPFTDEDRETAELFAEHATGAVMVAVRLAGLAELTSHLETALKSRAVIEQAKGVLMTQEHCTADEAFAIMRKSSQNRNLRLRSLAAEIVARTSRGATDQGSNL